MVENGSTPLIRACERGYINIFSLLLLDRTANGGGLIQSGADINLKK